MVQDFKNLNVWKESFNLVKQIYIITRDFPKEELYGLTSQLRRAIVSVSSNIAEGCGRRTEKDVSHFLHNALGSCKECENLLLIAKDFDFIKDQENLFIIFDKLDKIGKQLNNLIIRLNEEKETIARDEKRQATNGSYS